MGIWSDAEFGPGVRPERIPDPHFDLIAVASFALAGILALALLFTVSRCIWEMRTGRRVRVTRPRRRALFFGLLWLLWLLFIWYTVYSPLPLFLPYGFPDLWPTLASRALMSWLFWTQRTGSPFRDCQSFDVLKQAVQRVRTGQPGYPIKV